MEKYITLRKIGSGASGDALLVQEISSTKIFLMKIINIRKLEKEKRLRCFNEIKILQNLQHANITKYRESFIHSK